ncbi:MAG: glycosyltransferase family 2 protein [Gemmatimonadota bacterium]
MGEGRSLAPIVFFGYNRGDHAVRALESIKACPECDDTPITIYMDGAKNEEGVPAVETAREAVRSAAPAHAEIICREKNMGLANSVRAGVSAACDQYGRVIVVEDDLLMAPTALTWFNAGLDHYQDEDRVMHIAGYWPEPSPKLAESFFVRWPAVWGWATWASAWEHLEWDLQTLMKTVEDPTLAARLDEGGWNFTGQLRGTAKGRYDSWGIRWYVSVLREEGLALHPRDAQVINTGTDGSGVHIDESKEFDVPLGTSVPAFPTVVEEDLRAVAAWGDFVRRVKAGPLKVRIVRRAKDVVKGGARSLLNLTPGPVERRLRALWHALRAG